ncbi:aminotransferase class I/II-fold pyridoxal phosphate-dependent enzyme [Marnyiella aurantia]|uniref:Aminotransferase class I/II-fold pyridoxal phosphate-dependent enzyme n=1 Tax=Marnyiella aurantia TaxID=2758037 RepID=A0A7D7LNJ4_9FLAO|nr:aminotransferase class V-fold PLP-dependent enzyme [Marnyiella aurantia]MBA5247425.1 aminotransferase class I/II-fold pyridoxal phosphate-dependent enzyme [Marnyiella aurantia]QMS99182.1 aminotransferase class I/II-fold pyridoxal phosphate-dependent enzyme [Marnyiella aurantia]
MNPKILLSTPHMGGNELKYIHQAFTDNWVAPLGANVNGFESDLEEYLGNGSHVAVTSAGTAALHLALVMLDIGPGDEVFCQSMTFAASANPIAYVGATPVFIDSEKDTWNICPEALQEALADRAKKGKLPKAVIIVHLYGMPAKMDELISVCNEYGVPMLEDAAEALGSTYKGVKCGTFGQMAILSFNGNKIITTSGGGALVTKDPLLKKKSIFLGTQARDAAAHYEHTHIGYNYRLSNISAGIGRGQMEVLDERVAARKRNQSFYANLFKDVDGIEVFTEPNEDFFSNHWLTSILVDPAKTGFTREDLRLRMLNKGIESRPLWKPMHMQPVFRGTDFFGSSVSEELFRDGLCMPSGSNLGAAEHERIAEAIQTMVPEVAWSPSV